MRRIATVTAVVLGVVMMASAGWAAAKKNAKTDSGGADGQFTDNLTSAVDQARQNKKLIMLDFTGSDWCGYCMKLKAAVFDTQDFKKWAGENLYLVEVDFPQQKVLPKEVKEQNDKLKEKYKPNGYPTIVFVTDDGTEIGRMVGFGGDAKAWSKEAASIVAKNPANGKAGKKG